jgi:ADP-ribosylglycohydrolase
MKFFGDVFQAGPGTPFPNSYWVEPGRFLAGEYPGISRVEPAGRVALLLEAGITSFIDLTGEGELPPYHLEFDRSVVHRRFPIVDHGLPHSPEVMDKVVAAIDADLAAGRRVYVHCRAGIGRTGMAVGCYLIHQGLDGPAALEKLQELWQRCARSKTWPSVPETEEQIRYLREWIAPSARAAVAPINRRESALLGLAIGEGLGHLTAESRLGDASWIVESKRIDQLPTGSDTAMTSAALESLLENGKLDAHDQLSRYAAWSQLPGNQARLPAELKRVLAMWQWSRKRNPGSHDPKNLDAHPLARTLAAALFAKGDAFKAAELAVDLARTTLQSPLVLDVVRIWAATVVAALSGASKADVLTMSVASKAMHGRQLKPQIAALVSGNWSRSEPADGAISIVATALDVFRFTQSFEMAVREGARTSPSCAALVGSMAGAHYGLKAIPQEWVRALGEAASLSALGRRFGS